ncbi:MAG: thioredoxin family protein [Tenericutes bacterium]|nr:thioredoxin family protein [Mycoplasmatota bacterium]
MNKLLNEEVTNQVKEFLKPMKEAITFVLFTKSGECITCEETRALLNEVSALNDLISLVEKDLEINSDEASLFDVTLAPSFIILDKDGVYQGVKFNGIPAGHEINSFLTAVLDMSGLDYQLDPAIIERLSKIDKDVNIKVFVTLSCPHCPGAVSKAHRLAMLNSHVNAEMIEAQTFSALSQKYNVSGVPKIVINETHELTGNQPLEAFLDELERL